MHNCHSPQNLEEKVLNRKQLYFALCLTVRERYVATCRTRSLSKGHICVILCALPQRSATCRLGKLSWDNEESRLAALIGNYVKNA